MFFTAEFLEELSERADIVDIVSEYVELKPKGSSLFGLCPFHSEKTPLFQCHRINSFSLLWVWCRRRCDLLHYAFRKS